MRRLLPLLLLLLAAAGCGGSSASISTGALPRLVLQPADVGPGFQRFEYGRQLIADAQPAPRRDPARFGRRGGWIVRYRRNARSGVLTIESRADVFRNAGGARHDLAAYGTLLRAAGAGARVEHPPAAGLGRRATTLLFDQGSGASALRTIAVAWQEANASASITVQGFAKGTAMASALRLARLQERRLRAAER